MQSLTPAVGGKEEKRSQSRMRRDLKQKKVKIQAKKGIPSDQQVLLYPSGKELAAPVVAPAAALAAAASTFKEAAIGGATEEGALGPKPLPNWPCWGRCSVCAECGEWAPCGLRAGHYNYGEGCVCARCLDMLW